MESNRYCSKRKIVYFNILFIFILVFFLVINFLTPLMGEDYVLTAFPNNYKFSCLNDLLQSMLHRIKNQMEGWNVRVGEQLSIIFGCFDKMLFNITNSFMAIYYLWLINIYAFKNKVFNIEHLGWNIFISFSMIILFQPALGEIFFWRTGSTNYLWGICILLTFGVPIRYYIGYERIDIVGKSYLKKVILVLLGFFAGFTNENTVAMFLVMYIGVIIYDRVKKRQTPSWVYLSFASLFMGFVFMIKAPSTAIRMAYYNELFGIGELKFNDYILRAQNVIVRFFVDNKLLLIITLVCIILGFSVLISKNKKYIREVFIHSEVLGLLLLTSVSCGALIMSPYIETRAFLLSDFMLVSCIVYYSNVVIENIKNKVAILKLFLYLVVLIPTVECMANIYETYKEYNDFCLKREKFVEISDLSVFYWGEYYGETNSRILTTREDYLMGNEQGLEYYFSKNIDVVDGWICDIETTSFLENEAIGYIEWVDYDSATKTLQMSGWCVLSDSDSTDSEIYTYIQIDNQKYYFRTSKSQRPDVAEALSSNMYLDAGYYTSITLVDEVAELDTIEIGACVVNRADSFIGEIETKTYNLR